MRCFTVRLLAGVFISSSVALAVSPAPAPGLNTWLVLGPFDNSKENAGFGEDFIGEQTAAPKAGNVSGGLTWRYFDDRLFSRNYDDYQDLFSYFRVKQKADIAAKAVYAHVYFFIPQAQSARLRIGADNEYKAWMNGASIGESIASLPYRDMADLPVELAQGWNRLLLKVANQEAGRLGFYARVCAADGTALPGLIVSTDGPEGALRVVSAPFEEIKSEPLPAAYREWPYVGARANDPQHSLADMTDCLRKPEIALYGSDFRLTGAGGEPPYRWTLKSGALPPGLNLQEDGTLIGVIDKNAELREYAFTVELRDKNEASAEKTLAMVVKERPNKWFEEARLSALIHHPESMPENAFDDFSDLMKRQGYALGMVISYNNGDYAYRWPSIFQPDNPLGDLVSKYKTALEAKGLKFGMYIGNLNGPNHNGDNGAILLVEDAIRRYHPAAFWFDWAGWDGVSLDALYSMIKSYDPDTLVVLNGIQTMSNGDWDVIDLEGWGAWGDRTWELWPFSFSWPKRAPVETWRLLADPAFEYSLGVHADWQAYLRLQIALCAEGFVPNIDHSPAIQSGIGENGKLDRLLDSPLMRAHQAMADWANPPGLPPLYESYTRVNPGPLPEASWGYNVVNLPRNALYLHVLKTPLGKTGKPDEEKLVLSGVAQPVAEAVCMNTGKPVSFDQDGAQVTLHLDSVQEDPVDTIIKLRLTAPLPDTPPPLANSGQASPPGNLAWRKPARLLNVAGTYALPASAFHFARYGVDGNRDTFACGGNEWAWSYHVDLEKAYPLNRIVIHFGSGYPTQYRAAVSEDGEHWRVIAEVSGCKGGTAEYRCEPLPARYIRVTAVKPDGPDQEGVQMSIAELEAYALQ